MVPHSARTCPPQVDRSHPGRHLQLEPRYLKIYPPWSMVQPSLETHVCSHYQNNVFSHIFPISLCEVLTFICAPSPAPPLRREVLLTLWVVWGWRPLPFHSPASSFLPSSSGDRRIASNLVCGTCGEITSVTSQSHPGWRVAPCRQGTENIRVRARV